MNLTRAIRCVINHDTEDLFEKDMVTFSDLVHWGGLSDAALTKLFNRSQGKGKKEGFTIEFSTWSDTHIARASVSWQAIGQAKPDIVKAASKATT